MLKVITYLSLCFIFKELIFVLFVFLPVSSVCYVHEPESGFFW